MTGFHAERTRPTQPQAEGLVEDDAELLWCGQIDALVDDAFETVSRNPSDHEIAVAYRRAILRALRSPEPSEEMVEKVARALCEYNIRQARRHDTPPTELAEMLPASVDYAWQNFIEPARAALSTLSLPDR